MRCARLSPSSKEGRPYIEVDDPTQTEIAE